MSLVRRYYGTDNYDRVWSFNHVREQSPTPPPQRRADLIEHTLCVLLCAAGRTTLQFRGLPELLPMTVGAWHGSRECLSRTMCAIIVVQ